jgi:hypothetical protein
LLVGCKSTNNSRNPQGEIVQIARSYSSAPTFSARKALISGIICLTLHQKTQNHEPIPHHQPTAERPTDSDSTAPQREQTQEFGTAPSEFIKAAAKHL